MLEDRFVQVPSTTESLSQACSARAKSSRDMFMHSFLASTPSYKAL